MKPKPFFALLVMLFATSISNAQQPTGKAKKRPLKEISFAFTNTQPSLPFGTFSKLFTGNYHPGIEVSTSFSWKEKPKHDWIQVFSFGYSYQRWVQHSFTIYTELGYRYKFPAGFSLETKLGGGYMRAIVANESFSDGVEDGKQYSKIVSGRSQAMATLGFALAKKINAPIESRVFVDYQQLLQTPFIQSYVPLMPYNIIKLGIAIPLKSKTKNQKS